MLSDFLLMLLILLFVIAMVLGVFFVRFRFGKAKTAAYAIVASKEDSLR